MVSDYVKMIIALVIISQNHSQVASLNPYVSFAHPLLRLTGKPTTCEFDVVRPTILIQSNITQDSGTR